MPSPVLAFKADLDGDLLIGDAITGDVLSQPGASVTRGVHMVDNGRVRASELHLTLNNDSSTRDHDYSVGGDGLTTETLCNVVGTYSSTDYELWAGRILKAKQQGGPRAPRVQVDGIGRMGRLIGRNGFSTQLYESITIDTAIGHLLDASGVDKNAQEYALDQTFVAFWGMGESSGDAIDATGNGHDLTVSIGSGARDVAALDDQGDGCITFDNSATTVSDSSPAAALDDTFDGGGTLVCIIDPNSDGESSFGNVYARSDFSRHYHRLYLSSETGGASKLGFSVNFDTTAGGWLSANPIIPNGEVSVIVVVYNADATSNDPTIYVWNATNGLLTLTVGSGLTETSTPAGTRRSVSGIRLDIGSDIFGNNTFDGEIDEVGVSTTSWTATQAKAWFARCISAPRDIDVSTTTLNQWWLDVQEEPRKALEALCVTDGPHARIYEKGNGGIKFEANGARTTDTRSTNLQRTINGDTTEPIAHKLVSYDDGIEQVVNLVSMRQVERGSPITTAPQFVERVQFPISAASSISFTPAAVPEDGDILVAFLQFKTAATFTGAPTGFTEVPSGEITASGYRFRVYWKRAQDESSGAYSFSLSTSVDAVGTMVVYRGCIASGAPFDAESSGTFTSDSTPTTASITVLGTTRRSVVMVGTDQNVTQTPPTDYIERSDQQSGTGSQAVSDGVLTASGSTSATATLSSAVSGATWIIALTPDVDPVWRYGRQLTLGNDEVVNIVARAGQPFKGAVTPVSGTDFTVSAGSVASISLDRTSGQSVKITITAGASGATIDGPADDVDGGIYLRAQPMEIISENIVSVEDATSQASYGTRGLPSSLPYRSELTFAAMDSLADAYLAALKDPRPVVVCSVVGNRHADALTACLATEISDRVRVVISDQGIDTTGWVETLRHKITAPHNIETTFTVRKTT